MKGNITGRLFMIIALFESLGDLAGTGLMRTFYQRSLSLPGYEGGLIYYIAAVSGNLTHQKLPLIDCI